jgi:3-oxoacyl-[acyl-carrier protein] reductase
MMAVNVASPLFCVQAVAKEKDSQATARNIIFVGSIDGVKPVPTGAPYATTKGALVALARALGKELGPRNILVNVVAPGLLESGASRMVPEETKREYLKHSAFKRFGKPEEIARSIAWLALSNTYITGQTLVIDGGL